SLADRAAGLQFLQLALDRDGIDVRLEASFAMAGLGMEPVRLEQDLGAWRTEGTRKGVAMTGAAKLRLGRDSPRPDPPFPSSRTVCVRGAGLGVGGPWRGRWPNFTASSRWHGPTRRRTIPLRLPAPRWRATVRWAGAPCWPRTRPPGMRAGSRATYSSRATM